MLGCGLNPSGSGQGPVVGPSDLCNQSSALIKGCDFLDRQIDNQVLKNDSETRRELVTMSVFYELKIHIFCT